jgi:hypothetical protein
MTAPSERFRPQAARGFCRCLRSDAGEKLLARSPRGRLRLVVFLLSLALSALIVGPTEPVATYGPMQLVAGAAGAHGLEPLALSPEPVR